MECITREERSRFGEPRGIVAQLSKLIVLIRRRNGRFGTVDEVAPTALLLASSPDGDLYMGQTFGPNSGDVM